MELESVGGWGAVGSASRADSSRRSGEIKRAEVSYVPE